MARLLYSAITSLDGYTVDADGDFSWAAPDHEVHQAVNDLERPVGTYLYGRRMFDVMSFWQDAGTQNAEEDDDPAMRDYAQVWRRAHKVVFSTTLEPDEVTLRAGPLARLERRFDPLEVRELVDHADHDASIGGATLAAQALRAGIVDEIRQFVVPCVVGAGTPFLPPGLRLGLTLSDERRFDSGVVLLRYVVRRD